MNKQFVIAAQTDSIETKNAITDFVRLTKGWAFWHWIDGVWLVSHVPADYTASKLYFELLSRVPSCAQAQVLIFDLESPSNRTCWGRSDPQGWEWLQEFWGRLA